MASLGYFIGSRQNFGLGNFFHLRKKKTGSGNMRDEINIVLSGSILASLAIFVYVQLYPKNRVAPFVIQRQAIEDIFREMGKLEPAQLEILQTRLEANPSEGGKTLAQFIEDPLTGSKSPLFTDYYSGKPLYASTTNALSASLFAPKLFESQRHGICIWSVGPNKSNEWGSGDDIF